MAIDREKIQELTNRHSALKEQRQQWLDHWQEIHEYILPHRGHFTYSGMGPNQGEKRHSRIIDGTATRALRILAAGMQSGLTSPSRPWFRLTLSDLDLVEYGPVRWWLDLVERNMYHVFSKSNFYSSVMDIYSEISSFGTSVIYEEERPYGAQAALVWFKPFTVGEYCLSEGPYGLIDTIFRECYMTGRQIEAKFGKDNLSPGLRSSVDKSPDENHKIIHIITPRTDRQSGYQDRLNMPWVSCYLEEMATERVLSESGYMEFPCMCPRWGTAGADVYGRSPGMDILADVKMLQEMQKSFIKAIHKGIDPPLKVPSGWKGRITTIPGGINYLDAQSPDSIGPLYNVNVDLASTNTKIQQVQEAIRAGFFNDLFLMILERPGMTATEVMERHEEKLMMLGPVVERMFSELLDPTVNRTFGIMGRSLMLPPPPEEIMGQEIKVEYMSLLAQAQKMIGTQAIQSTAGFVAQMAQINPEALDKFDTDEAIDQYAEMVGAPGRIIRSDDQVMELRAMRAQQQQAMQEQAAIQQGLASVKELAGTEVKDKNVMDKVGEVLGGIQ